MAGVANAKNMHKVFGTNDKLIKGSAKIEIYLVDPIPIMSIDQIQGEDYIYDYHVTKSLQIKRKLGIGIVNAVLDTTQYMPGVNKKCPFMGKYAVHFRQGTRSLTIILSADPCDKAIIFCPGSIIDKKHIDLIEKSSIIAAVAGFFTSQVIVEEKK